MAKKIFLLNLYACACYNNCAQGDFNYVQKSSSDDLSRRQRNSS